MNPKILAGVVVIAAALISVRDIRAGDFVWTGEAGTTAWRDAGNWTPSDRFPGAEDVVRIEGGEVTVEVAEEVGILELHGGTLGGGGTLTIRETLVWAGEARLTGTGRTILGEEAVGWVESPQAVLGGPEIGRSVLEIRGHLGFADGGVLTLTNVATVEIAPGGSVDLSGDPGGFRGGGRIVNRGLLQKTAAGDVSWHYYFGPSLRLINDGIVSVRRGRFSATGGVESVGGIFHAGLGASLTVSGRFRDAAFLGMGEIVLWRGAELQGDILADHLTLSFTLLTGTCRLKGDYEIRNDATLEAADVTVDGRLGMVGGRQRWQMRRRSRLEVSPGGVLSVEGELNWVLSGTNTLVLNRGEILTRATGKPITVTLQGPFPVGSTPARWINAGILHHRQGQLSLDAPELGGTVMIDAEADVEIRGNSKVPPEGLRAEGEGWLMAPSGLALDGNATVERLRLAPGGVYGSGTLEIERYLDARFGGGLSEPGATIIGPGAVADLGSFWLSRHRIINYGTVRQRVDFFGSWSPTSLSFHDGATLENHGVIDLGGETQWLFRGGKPCFVVNHGRILRTDGDGETVFVNLPLVNHGRIEVDRGWLSLLGPVQLEPSGTLQLGLDADPDGYRGPRLIFGRPLALAGGVELKTGSGWDADPVRRRELLRAPEVSGIPGTVAVVPGGTGAPLRLVYRSDGVDVVEGSDGTGGSTGLAVFRDGGIRLGVESVPGRDYRLEVSSDLRSWIPWSTNRVPVVDPEDPHRFFRIAPDP